jgi:DNA-binding MarR family transcriptional regulator
MENQFKLTGEQISTIKEGFVKSFDGNELKVWLVIQSYVQQCEIAFPSQQTLADGCGIAKSTVSLAIKKLEAKGLLNREVLGTTRKKTIYMKNETGLTARILIQKFCELYQQTFGVNYNPNWAREMSMVKNKLISKYTDEQLEAMIQIGVTEFERRWANGAYQRPTIGMLCTWLGNQTLTVWQYKQEQEKRFKQAEQMDFSKYNGGGVI